MSVEDELCFTRSIASQLLRLLQLRNPSVADAYLNELAIDARATLDRTFEAILVLLFRHHIEVEPVRKLLWAQDTNPDQFILTRRDGSYEVVGLERLFMLAGIEPPTDRAPPPPDTLDEVPF